jgi:hypothetical protein
LNGDLFKYAGKLFNNRFLQLLNNIWNNSIPPKSWQKAVVVPLHNKGDIKNHENYREISLLNTGYKIYTSITKNKLTKFYENLTGEEQNGFCIG